MYRAVHADRGGRILVTDYPALAFDGARMVPFAHGIPLPTDALVVPIEREALASERSGKPRRLGGGRLAAAALLPAGDLRVQLPAYLDATDRPDLAPRPYAAVAADADGALVTSALHMDRDTTHVAASYVRTDIAARVADGLRDHPGDRLVRQLARCAKEYGCRAAANSFIGRWECALPLAAPANERHPAAIAGRRDGEAVPTEGAAFHPTTDEVARLALDHVAAGGTIVSFGRACEGEPLLIARDVADAIVRIRAGTPGGTIHLETNGSVPGSLRRIVSSGLDSITFRLMSARAATYEALHAPDGYRFPDVRASIRLAADLHLDASVLVLVLPGLFDRPDEVDALISLLGDLAPGGSVRLRDLHADPYRALALALALAPSPARGQDPVGVADAVERLRAELPHLRFAAFVRPLMKVPHVP